MWAAAGLARNTTAAATSSTAAIRPSGIRATHASCAGDPGGIAAASIGVATGPGATALTRILCSASSIAAQRVPWGNMYEYGMAVTFITVVAWLVVIKKFPVRHLTGFLLLPVVILMFINGTMLYTVAAPVVPALQSYWLVIHVSAAIIGSGVFLVPGVASVLYLFRTAHDRNPAKFAGFGPKLPAADVLDRIAYRATIVAFPIFTFGVLCGAVWAEAAWGRFWGWDPKETVAFIAWVIYAAYLHSRATAGWRGTRAAVINIVGFAATIFNLFFVNLVTVGLHSYAGVS